MSSTVSPNVIKAVESAHSVRVKHLQYIIKALIFHAYFIPTTLLCLPFVILWCLRSHAYCRHPQWTVMEAIGVILTKRTLKLLSVFKMQPIPPRENGWREANNWVGSFLSMLNMSGPGGIVALPPAETSKASEYVKKGRVDRDWFNPPPLEWFSGILSIKTGNNSMAYGPSSYQGPALVDPSWAKTRIRGFWFMHDKKLQAPRPGPFGSQQRRVLLYFHGGAGVSLSAGDAFVGQTLCGKLSSSLKMDIFSVDYNLAPHGPFPVAVAQALAGYLHLINEYGYQPSQIFIGGDSYGSWVTTQLEQYLRCDAKHLTEKMNGKADTVSGVPGLILLSPWLYLFDTKKPSRSKGGVGRKYDILAPNFADWGLDSLKVGPKYFDRCPAPLEHPWISPGMMPKESKKDLPPIFMSLGGLEMLFDEDYGFVEQAKEAGVSVDLHVDPYATHDFGTMFTFSERFDQVCDAARTWLAKTSTK